MYARYVENLSVKKIPEAKEYAVRALQVDIEDGELIKSCIVVPSGNAIAF